MTSRKIRIGDYCDVVKGETGIKKAIAGKYPLVVTAENRLSHNKFQFDCKAVIVPLVSSTGHGHASIKRIHYQEGKFALGTILCAIIVKDEKIIHPKFLYIYLSYFKDHLLVPLMKGAANVTLTIKKVKTVEILLPEMKRQLEIIELEKNNSIVKELDQEIQTQKQLLAQLQQAILQEAIEGKLTAEWRKQQKELEPASQLLAHIKAEKARLVKEKKIKAEKALAPIQAEEVPFELPEGWVWCRLGEIMVNALNQNIHKELNPNEVINYVDIDSIDNRFQRIRESKKLKVSELSSRARKVLKKGDIMYSLVRPYLDNVAIIESDKKNYIGSTGFAVFNCLEVENHFVFWVLQSKYIKDLYLGLMDGFNSPSISHNQFKSTVLPIPPLQEQEAIVKKVEVLMQQCKALEAEITCSEQQAQQLMQAVLKEAFEGKEEVVAKNEEQLV